MTVCTNCNHAKKEHREGTHAIPAGGACNICKIIDSPSVVSCTEYSEIPGGTHPWMCTGFGHKEWCSPQKITCTDATRENWYAHFNRKDSVAPVEKYMENLSKRKAS